MDWFFRWPKEALCEVGVHNLSGYTGMVCSHEIKQQVIEVMADIQENVNDACIDYYDKYRRQCYVTPRSFLTFIDAYKGHYKDNLDTIKYLSSSMSNGLGKLEAAAEQVDGLKVELVKTQEEIAIKNVEVEEVGQRMIRKT